MEKSREELLKENEELKFLLESGDPISSINEGDDYKIEYTNITVACEIANILQEHKIIFSDFSGDSLDRMDSIFTLVKELRRSY